MELLRLIDVYHLSAVLLLPSLVVIQSDNQNNSNNYNYSIYQYNLNLNITISQMTENSYQQYMPELLTIQKSHQSDAAKNSMKKYEDEAHSSKVPDQNKNQTSLDPNANQNFTTQFKANELRKIQESKRQQLNKRKNPQNAQKMNEMSKSLIQEMMNKIASKNIAEELYPVSNETINKLIGELDMDMQLLMLEVKKRQTSLQMNPTNQHIKKELQGFQKSLNQVKTIKQLYHEKIQSRNKIAELEARIISLKSENRELKIKIARGIEKIESHIHNLPCQKEKQLNQEVDKYKMELKREKEMRENLEINIKNIVINFKRFYEEADTARRIITEKLKKIDDKENQLNNKIEAINLKNKERDDPAYPQNKSSTHKSQQPHFESKEALKNNKTDRKGTSNQNQSEIMNLNHKKSQFNQTPFSPYKPKKTVQNAPQIKEENQTTKKKEQNFQKHDKSEKFELNLEQQIQKMRNNQLLFSKNPPRKL